jgi:HEAT repeats
MSEPAASLGSMTTPRLSIEAECGRRGKPALVAGCVALLNREPVDDTLVMALGVQAGPIALDGGPESQYWLRVWAARGLLWAWDPVALPAIIAALEDEHWRVREMAAKVVARHLLGDAFDAVSGMAEDPVPRVVEAAARAVRVLIASDS